MNRVYETRKARQDFEGLGELFLFLFPKSGSIYFFMLLGLVAAETIGEGEADDSAKVHFVDDVLTSVGVVQMVVACLSINKRIECFFEVFVEPLGWVICYLMLA